MRAPGTRKRRHHVAKVELEQVRKGRVRLIAGVEQALGSENCLDPFDQRVLPAGEAQVGECLGVYREETHRGTVLRRHVGDRGPVG